MSNDAGARGRTAGLRIAISGKSGCGNSTVSRLVAAKLGIRMVNYTFKDLARDKGMSLEEIFLKLTTKDLSEEAAAGTQKAAN